MIQHVSVNNRQSFPGITGEELTLMPVSTSAERGGGRLYDGPPSLSPGGLYRGDTVEDHPFLFFADEDDDDDEDDDIEEDDDDFDDAGDDFDDDFEDDDFDDDDDDDFDDDDEEYDYEEDVDYDEFDE
jgi:hypothetical protein